MIDWDKIQQAVAAVENNVAKRIDLENNVVVYRVNNLIRIDMKER